MNGSDPKFSRQNDRTALSAAARKRILSFSRSCDLTQTPPSKLMMPIHPGAILRDEFLAPLELSQVRLAKELSVPPRRIHEIVRGSRSIRADIALRLARYFGTSERFWLICKRATTWKSRRTGSAIAWRKKSRFERRRPV